MGPNPIYSLIMIKKKQTINISIEIFPIKNLNKEIITKIILKTKKIGIKKISITFSNKISFYNTINQGIQIKKYNKITILHTPFWLKNKNKIFKILIKNNIKRLLILKGDLYKKNIYNINNKIKKQITKNNFKLYAACYLNNHFKTKNTLYEIINMNNKIIYGIKYFISQIIINNNIINNFTKINKKYIIKKNMIIGIPLINNFLNIEGIIINNNYSFNKPLNQVLINKKNKYIKNYFKTKIFNIIKQIIKKKFYNIHLYSMNKFSLINKIKNILTKK